MLRCRHVCVNGLSFGTYREVVEQAMRIIEHPWVACTWPSRSKRERRARRVGAPPVVPDACLLYRSDGAARGQGHVDDKSRVRSDVFVFG